MGAQIKLSKEEYVGSMGQRLKPNDAATKDAQITLSKVECALSMGQGSNCAVLMDAQILLRKEECALGMGQRLNINDVVVKDAQI
jgi:hypothetical protein